MIFVTVGTHEQPFNRLVKAVDMLKLNGKITESVFIQTGYSTYVPQACEYKDFISMKQIDKYMQQASIVITHGGPSSFVMALQYNKVPIVVPRLSKYNEHVNDHQLTFCNELIERNFPIKVVENIDSLTDVIGSINLNDSNKKINLNNDRFVQQFKVVVSRILK
ncbi:glycosyltransferase [Lactiplantibacillus plantarum]|uniref:glycosyltransferase n=1 Tax=Lactiplantibacillus plantarum TaxID=1590 RepID=UPI00223764FB|nr:glycosyltransferase [Lactiplantibacillus plantarum]MCW6140243.1 multidrug MFS transporter [Lactiplantibacillus plantarum]